ncbi:MAG: hypothetical protein ACLUD2_14105 [Clostridium sp.]
MQTRPRRIANRYMPGRREPGFTIIALPVPADRAEFAEIFHGTIVITTLDYGQVPGYPARSGRTPWIRADCVDGDRERSGSNETDIRRRLSCTRWRTGPGDEL